MYPFLFPGTGLAVSTYFLAISLGCIAGILWFLRRADQRSLTRISAIDTALVTLAGGFIGARLMHVFFEEPVIYRENPLRVFQVWNGGFVFYGGVIGGFIAAAIFCQRRREPFWLWADLAAPTISLSYALGRIGCLLNGCCYGKYCDLPWAVHLNGGFRHPTQVYATVWDLALCLLIVLFEKRAKFTGQVFAFWLFGHALGRAVMETFRDDPRGPLIYGLSLGSVLSLAFGIVGATLALSNFERSPK